MDSFLSSMVWAAPFIEMMEKAAGVEGGYEALDDKDGGRFTRTYQYGACWLEIGMTCTMNLIPSASWQWTGISFGFCPQFRGGWTTALVSIGTKQGLDGWKLEFEMEKSPGPQGGRNSPLPEDVWRWYIDSAKALLEELGVGTSGALRCENIPVGDAPDALATIRKAAHFFLARAQSAPFNSEQYSR